MNKVLLLGLLSTIFIAGCVNLDYNQELYRDGTSDLEMRMSIDMPGFDEELEETAQELREEIDETIDEEYRDRLDAFVEDGAMVFSIEGFDHKNPENNEWLGLDEDSWEDVFIVGGEDEFMLERDSDFFSNSYRFEIAIDPDDAFGDGSLSEQGLEDEVLMEGPDINEEADMFEDEPEENIMPDEGGVMEDEMFDDEMFEMMTESMSFTYTLTVFADIDETNGELIDDRTVEFDLFELEGETLYVEFSESSISGWWNSIFG